VKEIAKDFVERIRRKGREKSESVRLGEKNGEEEKVERRMKCC
jgi:hypothetical protein